jgi:hypothetical protein
MGFRLPKVWRPPEPRRAHALRDRAFDAGSPRVFGREACGLLPSPPEAQRFVLGFGADRDRPTRRDRARALRPERARPAVGDRELDLDYRRRAAGERRRPALACLSGRTRRSLLSEVDGEVSRGEPVTSLSLPLPDAAGRADQIGPEAVPGFDQQHRVHEPVSAT